MNLVKKVLIAHSDPKLKRRLVLLLADAGYDVRAHLSAQDAIEAARHEWFDLALIAEVLGEAQGLEVVDLLRQVQPTVPAALLAHDPELALVVKSIRLGLADVLPVEEDLRPLIRRVRDLLNPGVLPPPEENDVTPADLAEVERTLARINEVPPASETGAIEGQSSGLKEELSRLHADRVELEAKLQRTLHERNALESELKALLLQSSDANLQQAELNDLRSQRERVAAAQAAMELKARALSEQREEIDRERSFLQTEREQLAAQLTASALPEWATSAEDVAAMRERVHAEEARQRETAMRLQQEAAKIARERRRWHDDLDLLREQEKNLGDYEARLRKMQAQLEADRVLWFSTSARPETKSPFDEGALREAWQKLQRASELLETERAHVRDDRLCTQERESALKHRAEQLAHREQRLAETEARLVALQTPATPDPIDPPTSSMRSIARAPLEIARTVFGGGKKS